MRRHNRPPSKQKQSQPKKTKAGQPRSQSPSEEPVLLVVHHAHHRAAAETQTLEDETPTTLQPEPIKSIVATQTLKTQPPFNINNDIDIDTSMPITQKVQLPPIYIEEFQMESSSTTTSTRISPVSLSPAAGGQRSPNVQYTTIFIEPNNKELEIRQQQQEEQSGDDDQVDQEVSNAIRLLNFKKIEQLFYDQNGRLNRQHEPFLYGLELIQDVDHFFIQPGRSPEAFRGLKNTYDVIDSHGERLFYAGELWNFWAHPNWCTGNQKYYVQLLNSYGDEILSIIGKSGIAKLKYGSQAIGYIEEIPKMCGSTDDFWIKDGKGKRVFKITHEPGNRSLNEFEIIDKKMNKIGRVSKTWVGLETITSHITTTTYDDDDEEEEEDLPLCYSYGIDFPITIPVSTKVLMLTALFVLYFKYVGDSGREKRNEQWAWFTICICCTVALLSIVGFSFLAAYVFTH